MASSAKSTNEQEHLPARSGTPAAWMALALLILVLLGILFFDSIVCGTLRGGLAVLAWNQDAQLSIDRLSLGERGRITAQGLTLSFGPEKHRSILKSDLVEILPASPLFWIGFGNGKKARLFHEVLLGKTKVLIDRRSAPAASDSNLEKKLLQPGNIPWNALLPDAFSTAPVDLVVIGKSSRLSVDGLLVSLPDSWSGRLSYHQAMLDVGAAHQQFDAASATASWNGTTFRLGWLELSNELRLEEFTLSPRREKLEFGLRGLLGGGLLRGDGTLSLNTGTRQLAFTLVGENLQAEALTHLIRQDTPQGTGTIRQGRITFRGDPSAPMDADSSLRLVADNFRWEGRGWDTLRLAATLTGRNGTLTELVIHQKENEVVAQGQIKLPADWHEALRAPFTASFHARLQDAGALAALAGAEFAQLSGNMDLEGALKGSENKAEGYCNIVGSGMMVRKLPVDWLKGCLLFEGNKTRLSSLEVWSGKDRVVLDGTLENSRPHTYNATAQFEVANLTKRLAQIGISTASQIGGGAVRGIWNGDGSGKGHSGTFHATVNNWISPWTSAGMSGSFEGSYSPGHLYFSKAEFQSDDLRLRLQLSASPTQLEAKSIVATKKGRTAPLVQGDIALPLNAPALWQSGDVVANLGMKDPLALKLEFRGIKLEELAELLGQKVPCEGILAGTLEAGGTPELPQMHGALKIEALTLPGSATPGSFSLSLESTNGRLVTQVTQGSTLTLEANFPLRLQSANGLLHFADAAAPIQGTVTFHAFPLVGWLSLCGETAWKLRDGSIEGSLTAAGTLNQPLVNGNLELAARETTLPGLPVLGGLKLPISFTNNKAASTGGSALLGTNTLNLSGHVDWSNTNGNSASGIMELSGKNLPLSALIGLESRGDAALLLTIPGNTAPLLSGSLLVKQFSEAFPTTVVPGFVPPGLMVASVIPVVGPAGTVADAQVDLLVHTEGRIPLSSAGTSGEEKPSLQANLHVRGSTLAPTWTGSLTLRNGMLDLPAGKFFCPEATLRADTAGAEQLSFAASGVTRVGFCTLQHTGSVEHGDLEVQLPGAAPAFTTADVVLALASSWRNQAPPVSQLLAWNRQNQLFATPSLPWISRREGAPNWGGLGFYGRPWSALLLRPTNGAQIPPSNEQPKN